MFLSAGATDSRNYAEEQAELLMSRFLWLGQGQRYINDEDLKGFQESAIALNAKFPDKWFLLNGFSTYLKVERRLPEDKLSIIKLAILYTARKRFKMSQMIGNQYYGLYGKYFSNYGYITSNGSAEEFWYLMQEVTLTNYPILLSMFEQRLGRIEKIHPPRLRVTQNMIEIMRRSKDFDDEQVKQVLLQLEDGNHILTNIPIEHRVNHPFYANYNGETWAEIDWSLGSCKSLLGN